MRLDVTARSPARQDPPAGTRHRRDAAPAPVPGRHGCRLPTVDQAKPELRHLGDPFLSLSINRLMHLNRLRAVVTKHQQQCIFPCIEDLAENGLDLTRFADEQQIPSRQDVTQYIAAWFKYVELSADECRDWMIEYCVDVLSAIASSAPSRIRHSTKSNIKYIYSSDALFACGCEENKFKAACEPSCPVYAEMAQKAKDRQAANIDIAYEIKPEDGAVHARPPRYSVKQAYKKQFAEAMALVKQQLKQGAARTEIISLLNDKGFKSRTGRPWTFSILAAELGKLNSDIDPAEADVGGEMTGDQPQP